MWVVIIKQITIWQIDWYRFFNNFPENSNLLKNFDVKNLMKIYYNFCKTYTPTHLQIHQLSLQLCICGYQQETKIDLRALMCTCYIAVIVLFFSLMFVQIFFSSLHECQISSVSMLFSPVLFVIKYIHACKCIPL